MVGQYRQATCMKRIGFIVDIVMFIFLFTGVILCAVSALIIAPNNAMLDYYQQTNRQLVGWFCCFIPVLFAVGSGVLYWFRKHVGLFLPLSSGLSVIAIILPIIYMLIYSEALIYLIIGMVCIGIFAIAAIEFWLLRNTDTLVSMYGKAKK